MTREHLHYIGLHKSCKRPALNDMRTLYMIQSIFPNSGLVGSFGFR